MIVWKNELTKMSEWLHCSKNEWLVICDMDEVSGNGKMDGWKMGEEQREGKDNWEKNGRKGSKEGIEEQFISEKRTTRERCMNSK